MCAQRIADRGSRVGMWLMGAKGTKSGDEEFKVRCVRRSAVNKTSPCALRPAFLFHFQFTSLPSLPPLLPPATRTVRCCNKTHPNHTTLEINPINMSRVCWILIARIFQPRTEHIFPFTGPVPQRVQARRRRRWWSVFLAIAFEPTRLTLSGDQVSAKAP